MSSRRRYLVRSMRVAAGSFLTAATVATLTVIGSGPAAASSSTVVVAVHSHLAVAGTGTFVRRESDLLEKRPADARLGSGRQLTEHEERLAGLRAEMDQAVAWGMVTQVQADGFISQLATRIDRGF